jgi:hypothetical protein
VLQSLSKTVQVENEQVRVSFWLAKFQTEHSHTFHDRSRFLRSVRPKLAYTYWLPSADIFLHIGKKRDYLSSFLTDMKELCRDDSAYVVDFSEAVR